MATRRIVALGMGLALALAACGTDRELTEPEPVPATAERLAEALIEDGDLTAGYVTVEGESTPFNAEILPEHDCDNALADLEPAESVSRDFAGTDTTLTHSVAYFPGQGGQVEELFRDIKEDCSQVVLPDAGLSVRSASLDFGVLSDDTLPVAYELEPTTGAIEERDVILMRQGDLVSVIRLSGPRPSDKVLLDGAVRVAIGYLGLLHDDTT